MLKLAVPLIPPTRTIPGRPIQKRFLEPDVETRLLAFDPFMPENLVSLGQEFPVELRFPGLANVVNFDRVHHERVGTDFAAVSLQISATNAGPSY
jgi:hypothetical protein